MRENVVVGNTVINKMKNFEYYSEQKSLDEKMMEAQFEYINATKQLIREEIKRQVVESANEDIRERINELERDCSEMRIKLETGIPTNMLVIFSIMLICTVATLTIFVFQIVSNVKIIDFFLLFFVFIMCIGLLSTSIATIIYWKRYLINVRE